MVYNKCKIRNMLPIFNQLLNLLIWFLYTTVYILATYTTQQQITDIQIIGTFTLCTIHTVTILIIHTLYHSYCNNINYGKQLVSATQLINNFSLIRWTQLKFFLKSIVKTQYTHTKSSIKAWKIKFVVKIVIYQCFSAYCIVNL